MSVFVGIDLGTTFSAVARIDAQGKPVIVPSATGGPVTPSVICFATDPPTVGEEARLLQASGSPDVRIPLPLTAGRDGFGPWLAHAFGG